MQYLNIENENFTFIGQHTSLKGDFSFTGPTFISACMEGQLAMEDQGHITLELSAKFKGDIQCHDIDIYGNFEGRLKSTGKVTVHPSASINGDIKAKILNVKAGATLNIDGNTLDEHS